MKCQDLVVFAGDPPGYSVSVSMDLLPVGVVFFPSLPSMGFMLFPSFALGNVSGEGGTLFVPLFLFSLFLPLSLLLPFLILSSSFSFFSPSHSPFPFALSLSFFPSSFFFSFFFSFSSSFPFSFFFSFPSLFPRPFSLLRFFFF